MFLRESRAEIQAARRLLGRHSATATATAAASREGDAVATSVPMPAAAVEKTTSTVVAQPDANTIRDPGGEASAEKRVTISPALGALSSFGDLAETEGASNSGSSSSRITGPRPSDRSARINASGRAGVGAGGDLYRAALSTHLSFIATTAADDPPSSIGTPDGRVIEEGGRKPPGGVGEACRALQGDVAGVRQVRLRGDTWGW